MVVTFYILPNGPAWRVVSRGFVWDFEQAAPAMEFARDMAMQYARASGHATDVRFQDDDGSFHELQAFEATDAEGHLPFADASTATPATRGTVLRFRRKDE